MIIKYIGHACFKIKDEDTGYSIIFDPYKEGIVPGYRPVKEIANMVLCSHNHDDHCGIENIIKEESDNNPYKIQVIETYHDPEKGELRGKNMIHIVTHKATGEKLVHYGDIGETIEDLLTEDNLNILRDADIALIPVGGKYTYDAKQALALLERTAPKTMIPMHYSCDTPKYGYTDIDTIESFLDEVAFQNKKLYSESTHSYDSSQNNFSNGILIIKPKNVYF